MARALLNEELRYANGRIAAGRPFKVVLRGTSSAVSLYPDYDTSGTAVGGDGTIQGSGALSPHLAMTQPSRTSSQGRAVGWVDSGVELDLLLLDDAGAILVRTPIETRALLAVQASLQLVGVFGPAFGLNWTNYDTVQAWPQFCKDSAGVVYLGGLAKATAGPPANTIFTLPVGFRPTAAAIFLTIRTVAAANAVGRIDVGTGGNVSVNLDPAAYSVNDWVTLNGIQFASV